MIPMPVITSAVAGSTERPTAGAVGREVVLTDTRSRVHSLCVQG